MSVDLFIIQPFVLEFSLQGSALDFDRTLLFMGNKLWVGLSNLGFVLVGIRLLKLIPSVLQMAEIAHNIAVGTRSAGGAETDSVVRHGAVR